MEIGTLTKLYYSIGEVAELFDVTPSMIRYWETEFTTLKPGKNSKGERRYTPKDIKHLNSIYNLVKERGFTIDGAKKELSQIKIHSKDKSIIINKLNDLKLKILDFKASLKDQ
jgi:DNA-binding transcriptional MerR regulator